MTGLENMIGITKEQFQEMLNLGQVAIVTLKAEATGTGKVWRVIVDIYTGSDKDRYLLVAGRGPAAGKPRGYTSLDRVVDMIGDMGFRGYGRAIIVNDVY